jgi:hypothetical protein
VTATSTHQGRIHESEIHIRPSFLPFVPRHGRGSYELLADLGCITDVLEQYDVYSSSVRGEVGKCKCLHGSTRDLQQQTIEQLSDSCRPCLEQAIPSYDAQGGNAVRWAIRERLILGVIVIMGHIESQDAYRHCHLYIRHHSTYRPSSLKGGSDNTCPTHS